jgi:hypothetical protein
MFNRNKHKSNKDPIIPYSSNSKKSDLISMEILNKMRDTQQVSNYEYMMLAIQLQILEKLTSIEVSSTQTAVSTQFMGRYIMNRFKWV